MLQFYCSTKSALKFNHSWADPKQTVSKKKRARLQRVQLHGQRPHLPAMTPSNIRVLRLSCYSEKLQDLLHLSRNWHYCVYWECIHKILSALTSSWKAFHCLYRQNSCCRNNLSGRSLSRCEWQVVLTVRRLQPWHLTTCLIHKTLFHQPWDLQ